MSRRIVFITKQRHAASTRYRALAYFPWLQDAGWQPVLIEVGGSVLSRMRMLRAAGGADVVVVVRRTFGAAVVRLLRRAARSLVFDFDDAVYRGAQGESPGRMKRFAAIVSRCDQVWAGNDHLADQARAYCQDVRCLPSVVDLSVYATEVAKPTDSIDLVWIGGSATRGYLDEARPWLEQVGRQMPQLRLKIIADFTLALKNLRVAPVPWTLDTEAVELAGAHVGIAPMPDNPWTRGKCGVKVLQYMAAALPVVSSSAGVNGQMVVDRQTGFLADDDGQWVAAISQLAGDAQLRRQLGAAGRQRVEQKYCLTRAAAQMVADVEELV